MINIFLVFFGVLGLCCGLFETREVSRVDARGGNNRRGIKLFTGRTPCLLTYACSGRQSMRRREHWRATGPKKMNEFELGICRLPFPSFRMRFNLTWAALSCEGIVKMIIYSMINNYWFYWFLSLFFCVSISTSCSMCGDHLRQLLHTNHQLLLVSFRRLPRSTSFYDFYTPMRRLFSFFPTHSLLTDRNFLFAASR